MINTAPPHDSHQRQQALDSRQSFIVQAPAGSGKTELLIQRILTLLNTVQAPEEILAITFTKKAANEMRCRVLAALQNAMTSSELNSLHEKLTGELAQKILMRDQKLNWNLLQNPNRLRIQTIDSLCANLTKQLPLLSRFGSQPDIIDNPVFLYREAVQEVLSHVEENFAWSEAIAELLLHLNNDLNKLHDLLVNLLAKRDQWLPYIHLEQDDAIIKTQLEQHIELVIEDNLITLAAIFPKDLLHELVAIARFAAHHLSPATSQTHILYYRDFNTIPSTQPTDKKYWLGLAELLLTSDFNWRKRFDKKMGFPSNAELKNPIEKNKVAEYRQRLTAVIETLRERHDIRLALTELFSLPESCYSPSQWQILKALLATLKIVAAQLRLTFQRHGQIDYCENTQAALIALGTDESPTDLALALDYQIKHLLVDEFQDTSYTQYRLIEKLLAGWENNDGRTLFIVGDPMQSIYRFREAEVGLFIRVTRNGIGQVRLRPLTLTVNFRSAPKIVDWINATFQTIFPPFNDMANGAVSYSQSITTKTDRIDSTIQIQGYLNADDHTQANNIIPLIQKLKEKYPHDTIAILVRSRSHLTAVIPALKKAKLSYRAIDIDPLASRQHIQDLFSLTCALLHPADRLSWLAILRAPWCGLSLADLLIIAGDNPFVTVWEQLDNYEIIQRLSCDGQQRLLRIRAILAAKIADRERQPLRDWIESTWTALGGPACLNQYDDIDDVHTFFKLLENLGQNQAGLDFSQLNEKITQLYASSHHGDELLQIMTIHSAKGLEFDTVILPHLERKVPGDENSLLLWMERPLVTDNNALLLAPIHADGKEKDPIYQYIKQQKAKKSDYEMDRIFYVATTRTKKRLYLYFNTEKNAEGEFIQRSSNTFLGKLWPTMKEKPLIILDPRLHENDKENRNDKPLKRLISGWENPITETIKPAIAYHQKQTGFELPNQQPKLIGIVVHRVLQQLTQISVDWWQEKSSHQQEHYLKSHLIQLGMLPHELSPAIHLIQQAIHHTLHDPRGQWILHPHHEAKSEWALTAIFANQAKSIVIDRTFIDEQDTRWIIDFKTALIAHDSIDAFLQQEQEKYQEQMDQYYQAIRFIDDRPIRVGLYFPALPAWREWEPGE